ncbi:hypothetical protein [Methanofollis fontis]|uniref:Uncharacterized protein n=1 Tax=Methanofollis fontis TaxID=2052832 RepID=A0A483CSS4_9EURY|nr:hypothetical protein [Methanofollis fontis]TAJ45394.1 hypothetical protein CUJ86_01230 [Methanofollis fontis]
MNSRRITVVLACICLIGCGLCAGCTSKGGDAALGAGGNAQEGVAAAADASVQNSEQLEAIEEQIRQIAGAWEMSEITHDQTSVTAVLTNENGDTVTIRASVYLTPAAAMEAFEQAKNAYTGFKIVSVDAGDAGYAWTERTLSEVGVVKANAVTVIDYETPGGIGSGGSAAEAKALAQDLASVMGTVPL